MLHSPINYSMIKDPIRGVITDYSDSKRSLLFTKYYIYI